jgi:hypothetical protein
MTQTLDQQGRVIFAGFISSNLMKGTHGICHSLPVPWEPNTWRERQLTVSDLFRFAAISQVSLSARIPDLRRPRRQFQARVAGVNRCLGCLVHARTGFWRRLLASKQRFQSFMEFMALFPQSYNSIKPGQTP